MSRMFQALHEKRPPFQAHQNPPEQEGGRGPGHHHHRGHGGHGRRRGARLAQDGYRGVALPGLEPGHAYNLQQPGGGV